MRELRTPENIRGPNLLAQRVECEGSDDGTGLSASGGDTMCSGAVARREDFGWVELNNEKE